VAGQRYRVGVDGENERLRDKLTAAELAGVLVGDLLVAADRLAVKDKQRAEAAEAALSMAFRLFGNEDDLNTKRTVMSTGARRRLTEVMLGIREREQKGGA
jgi:hypothetical protein